MSDNKVLFEVYETDEENFKPYESPSNSKTNTTDSSDDEKKDETDTTTETETTEEESSGFTLHQGEILETYNFTDLYSIEYNKDYEGMNGNASVKLPFHLSDTSKLYKGVRCALKLKDDTQDYLCFITDSKFDETGVALSLESFEKLLEQNKEVSFEQMKRSEIMTEIIKMAGLKPKVDFKGLKDEVISYTSVSSSSSDNEGVTGDGSMTEEEVASIARTFHYAGIGTNHDPHKAWKMIGTRKSASGDCYDVTAWFYYVYNFKVGIPARDIVGKGYGSSGTHHVIQIKKNGNWQFPSVYGSMTTNLKVTGGMKAGDYKVSREPPSSDGSIPAYRNDWYGNRG